MKDDYEIKVEIETKKGDKHTFYFDSMKDYDNWREKMAGKDFGGKE